VSADGRAWLDAAGVHELLDALTGSPVPSAVPGAQLPDETATDGRTAAGSVAADDAEESAWWDGELAAALGGLDAGGSRTNREAVNVLYERMYGDRPLPPPALAQFLGSAATAVARLLRRAAEQASLVRTGATDPSAAITASVVSAPFDLAAAAANPPAVLTRLAAWERVSAADPDAGRWFALSRLAGRTARELADLFACPADAVRAQRSRADRLIEAAV
jgi:hypothetical protein